MIVFSVSDLRSRWCSGANPKADSSSEEEAFANSKSSFSSTSAKADPFTIVLEYSSTSPNTESLTYVPPSVSIEKPGLPGESWWSSSSCRTDLRVSVEGSEAFQLVFLPSYIALARPAFSFSSCPSLPPHVEGTFSGRVGRSKREDKDFGLLLEFDQLCNDMVGYVQLLRRLLLRCGARVPMDDGRTMRILDSHMSIVRGYL